MRQIRIYQPGIYGIDDLVELSTQASHHLSVVLRMQMDELVTLFSGDHYDYAAIITNVNRKKVTVRIQDKQLIATESTCAIHLAQAVAKGDRMDFVMQKAVELGVASITPVLTRYSSVRLNAMQREHKHAHWQAIILSACEQSGRAVLPELKPMVLMPEYIAQAIGDIKIILHPTATQVLQKNTPLVSELSLLIGPEGGFSAEEIELAINNNFTAIRFGPRILRTETAAIAAIGVLQAFMGDLLS